MKISKPTEQEINVSSVAIADMTPDELANEIDTWVSLILRQEADVINGARLCVVLRAAAEFLR